MFLRVLVLLVIFSATVFADELRLRESPQDRGLLVLTSGRVVHGELLPRPGGYDVMLPAGRMFVPSVQVRFTADSMDDAYQRMKDSIVEFTPATHLELARWCLSNHIPDRARREVLDALHLDPYNQDARRMLEDLRREAKRVDITIHHKSKAEKSTPSALDTVLADRRSLGGLPENLAKTFTQRIQPLIHNKCSNSRCHGPGLNSFVVTPVRRYSTSHIAEQNLAAVLNQIDFSDPARSPMLAVVSGPHGGSPRLLFSGQAGRVQSQMLQTWVAAVAERLASSEKKTDGVRTVSTNREVDVPDGTALAADTSFSTETSGDDGRFLAAADAATRSDDFDPKEFNRRFHPTANSENRPVRSTD